MTTRDTIRTGRLVAGRSDSSKYRCPGCEARLLYGEPRPNATWPARLRLDPDTADLLLIAAADFAWLSEEVGEDQSSVAFVDWVTGVLRQSPIRSVEGLEADGAPPRSEAGGPGHPTSQQRHPFPLPLAELPSKWRKVG